MGLTAENDGTKLCDTRVTGDKTCALDTVMRTGGGGGTANAFVAAPVRAMSILDALAASRRGPAMNRYEVLQFTQTVNTNRSQTSQLDGLPRRARPCLPRNDLLTARRSRSNERNLFSRIIGRSEPRSPRIGNACIFHKRPAD